jgi:hypothetical protein
VAGPKQPSPDLFGAFSFVDSLREAAEPVTYITGPNTRSEILLLAEDSSGPKRRPRRGHMVSELTTGVLAAMAGLVVSATLTLVAVFVAIALV